jgi:hypothetical protein
MLQMEEWPPDMEVAANILNKQSRTADKGGPPAWVLDKVLATPHHKNLTMFQADLKRLRTVIGTGGGLL